MNHKKLFLFVLLLISFFAIGSNAQAGTTPIKGWGWSSNIGWISFNSTNPGAGTGSAYNVTFSTTTGSSIGTLGGYAWSPNIGWVSFDPSDVTGCPGDDSASALSGCNPAVNISSGKVTGWARVKSVKDALPFGGGSQATSYSIFAGRGNSGTQKISSNNGNSWIDSITPLPYASDAVFLSTDGQKIAVTPLTGGVMISTNGGTSWTVPASSGSQDRGGIASSNDGQRIIAVGPYGRSLSIDGGVTWSTTFDTYDPYAMDDVAMSGNGLIVVANATGANTMTSGGIYKSTDGGITWSSIFSGLDGYGSITISKNNPQNIAYVDGPNAGVLISTNGGVNWTTRTPGSLDDFSAIASSKEGKLFAAAGAISSLNGYIYSSSDWGTTWIRLDGAGSRQWSSLAASDDGQVIVGGTDNGVFISVDGGTTWTQNFAGTSLWLGTAVASQTNISTLDNRGGFDGWIHLSGTNHASPNTSGYQSTSTAGVTFSPTEGTFSGYAWGSDVVGWLSFSSAGPFGQEVTCAPNCGGPVDDSSSLTLEASAGNGWSEEEVNIMANSSGNATVQVRWNPVNVDNVTLANDWPEASSGATVYKGKNLSASSVNSPASVIFTGIVQNRTEYLRLEYRNLETNEYDNEEVIIKLRPFVPTVTNCAVPANARLCQYSVDAQGVPSTVVGSCVSTMLDPITCEFYCPTGFVKVANTCKRPGTIEER